MDYIKKGLVFKPEGNYDWMHYYAGPLTPVEFDDFIRVYFTTRNKIGEDGIFNSRISFVDCDKNDPTKLLYIHNKPLIEFGLPGTFDEHGTTVCEVLLRDGKYHMYYLGWQRTDTAPYVIRMGLAISDDGVEFTKISDGPVLGLNRFLPYGIGNISILEEDGTFHMWYTHYTAWLKTQKGYRPTYDIRYAHSANGLDWVFGKECISGLMHNEAIASPSVKKINGQYHMWYCYRPGVDEMGSSGPYLIGYAVSDNKTDWTRMDETVNIALSATGWDSEMVCYPEILQTNDNLFMFYAGNHYGRDGFGCAVIENL